MNEIAPAPRCELCRLSKVRWRDSWLCLTCDSPADRPAAWAVAWAAAHREGQ